MPYFTLLVKHLLLCVCLFGGVTHAQAAWSGQCTDLNDGEQTIIALNGTIREHDGESNYLNNQLCTWHVKVPDTHPNVLAILFRFTRLDIEDEIDFVTVFAGSEYNENVVGEFTGRSPALNEYYTVPGRDMFIEWYSDFSETFRGFELEFAAVTCNGTSRTGCGEGGYCWLDKCICREDHSGENCNIRECASTCVAPGGACVADRCECADTFFDFDCQSRFCSGETEATKMSGLIRSNPEGEDYDTFASCVWNIHPATPPSGQYSVRLTFTAFATEELYDTVEVWDGAVDHEGSHRIALLTGTDYVTPFSVTATSGRMSIRFSSDFSFGDRGFVATYAVQQCDSACNGHGVCIDPEDDAPCMCDHGYGGPLCEETVCFPNCNGHGDCVGSGVNGGEMCSCTGGWSGPWCTDCKTDECKTDITPTCGSDSQPVELTDSHGNFGSAWHGTYKSGEVCTWNVAPARPINDTDGSGRVDSIGVSFDDEWGLPYEQVYLNIINGTRSNRGALLYSFTGADLAPRPLSIPTPSLSVVFNATEARVVDLGFHLSYVAYQCPQACNGWDQGVCVRGNCKCRAGYSGQACERRGCAGTPACSSNGRCLSSGIGCDCWPGYFGNDCSSRHCSGRTILYNESGIITDHSSSSSSSSRYLSNSNCEFVIRPVDGLLANERVSVEFLEFELEDVYDTLQINTGTNGTTLASLTGSRPYIAPIVGDAGQPLTLKFESDFSEELSGFMARYTLSRLCPNHCHGNGACLSRAQPGAGGGWEQYCSCFGGYSGAECNARSEAIKVSLNNATATVHAMNANEWAYFRVHVPEDERGYGPPKINIEVTWTDKASNGDANATFPFEVYTRFDDFPSVTAHNASEVTWAGRESTRAALSLPVKLPEPGTWYVAVHAFARANVSVRVASECSRCFYGTCREGMCECFRGFEGVNCEMRRTRHKYEYRGEVTGVDYAGYLVDFEATRCNITLRLHTSGNDTLSLDQSRNFTHSATDGSMELCAAATDDEWLFGSTLCVSVVNLNVTAQGSSGCVRFSDFFLFWDIYSEELMCFENVPYHGDCSGCPNDCGSTGTCRKDAAHPRGRCVCDHGYSGLDCSVAPRGMWSSCLTWEENELHTVPDEACVLANFSACPPSLSLSVDNGNAVASGAIGLNQSDERRYCIEQRYRGCFVCAVAPAPDRMTPTYEVSGKMGIQLLCGEVDPTSGGAGASINDTVIHNATYELGEYTSRQLDPTCDAVQFVCGNGVCEDGETLANCFQDCRCARALRPSTVGDGFCDSVNNVDCCWDGGDCCPETCVSSERFACGIDSVYRCEDVSGERCVARDGGGCARNCTQPEYGTCGANGVCECKNGRMGEACELSGTFSACTVARQPSAFSRVCVDVQLGVCPATATLRFAAADGKPAVPDFSVPLNAVGRHRYPPADVIDGGGGGNDGAATSPCVTIAGAGPSNEPCTVCLVMTGSDGNADHALNVSIAPLVTRDWRDKRYVVDGCAHLRVQCANPISGLDRHDKAEEFLFLGCFDDESTVEEAGEHVWLTAPECALDVCGDGRCTGDEDLRVCARDCGCRNVDVENRAHIGDGFCDQYLNVNDCADGGDCCAVTCVSTRSKCGGGGDGKEDPFVCVYPTFDFTDCQDDCGENGVCQSGVCGCQPGWRTAQRSRPCASPVCEQSCPANSTCSGPNECRCNPGYCTLEEVPNAAECGATFDRCGVCGGLSLCDEPNANTPTTTVDGNDDDDGGGDGDGMSGGLVFGIVVLCLALLACAITVCVKVRNRRRSYFRDVPSPQEESELGVLSHSSAGAAGGARRGARK